MELKQNNFEWILTAILVSMLISTSIAIDAVKHDCDRICIKGAKPLNCSYKWNMEIMVTLSKYCGNCPRNATDCNRVGCIPANGVRRIVTVLNRQMPGPSIVVCKNDRITVEIANHAGIDATTIHWHGINQVGTPYMDGVPFVTQCPINPFNSFTYSFTADDVGTYFYHSHMGFQRTDGVNGLLIVRQPVQDDPNKSLYDFDFTEHQIMITDWINKTGEEMFFEFYHTDEDYGSFLTAILVNGRGRLPPYQLTPLVNKTQFHIPYSFFTVRKGFRYRFRVCSNVNWICPVEVTVDNHELMIVGTDGDSVKPIKVNSFVINPGERFDFVLNANQDIKTYWMTFRGLLRCEVGGAFGRAILKYETARDVEPPEVLQTNTTKVVLNPVNDPFIEKSQVSLTRLQSFSPRDPSLKVKPDVKYYLPFNLYSNVNPAYSDTSGLLPMVNSTAFLFPPSPMLTQYHDIPKDLLCTDKDLTKNCTAEFCQCTYYLKVKTGAVVELVLIDVAFNNTQPGANHPWHLHGHHFRLIAEGLTNSENTVEGVKALDDSGKIKRNFDMPVSKDTVSVPHGGYSVLRFQATNPGFWAFHCHVEMHVETGMMLVFQVGELREFARIPKKFPKCGSYPNN